MSSTASAITTQTPTQPEFQLHARFFRVLGDPTRLQIVRLLLDGEKNVGELVHVLQSSQSRISNHLACLRWCGFVAARRQGREIYYRITDGRVAQIIELGRDMIAASAENILSCTEI